jgi:hypothetical protein
MDVSTAPAASTTKEYMPVEIQQIQAGYSLTSDVYDVELQEIFSWMLEEEWTHISTYFVSNWPGWPACCVRSNCAGLYSQ